MRHFNKNRLLNRNFGRGDGVDTPLSPLDIRRMTALPPHAQEYIDSVVYETGTENLAIIDLLKRHGLTVPFSQWFSVMEYAYSEGGRSGNATTTMEIQSVGENRLPQRKVRRVPLPSTHDSWTLNGRFLAVAERNGYSVQEKLIRDSVLNVHRTLEDMAFNGWDGGSAGYTIPGILNATGLTHVTYTDNKTWADTSKTGLSFLTDVLAFKTALNALYKAGSGTQFAIVVGTGVEINLDRPFVAGSLGNNETIREQISKVKGVVEITTADMLPAGDVLFFRLNKDTIFLIDGQFPVAVSWQGADPWTFPSAVIACEIVEVNLDYNSHTGVVLGVTS